MKRTIHNESESNVAKHARKDVANNVDVIKLSDPENVAQTSNLVAQNVTSRSGVTNICEHDSGGPTTPMCGPPIQFQFTALMPKPLGAEKSLDSIPSGFLQMRKYPPTSIQNSNCCQKPSSRLSTSNSADGVCFTSQLLTTDSLISSDGFPMFTESLTVSSNGSPINMISRTPMFFSSNTCSPQFPNVTVDQSLTIPRSPHSNPLFNASPSTFFPNTDHGIDNGMWTSDINQENSGNAGSQFGSHSASIDVVPWFSLSAPLMKSLVTGTDRVSPFNKQGNNLKFKTENANIDGLDRLPVSITPNKLLNNRSSLCNETSVSPINKVVADSVGAFIKSSPVQALTMNKEPKRIVDRAIRPPSPGGIKRAGPYLLGPRIGTSPVKSIVQVLARKDGTDNFYMLKILTLENGGRERQDDRQGKMLIHTEYSLLGLLHHQDGVVHHHGLFKDEAWEERDNEAGTKVEYTGQRRKRLCLVLDCLIPHNFSDQNSDLINLQHYVIKEKKLSEKEAIVIFFDIVRVVECLHKKNIVHRDLKLGNMVLNKRSRRITITNFCLGKHLVNENDLLQDQRGSPAYISPDVLSGSPYLGKPSDVWALGVVLFTMLYGQFPFYDSVPQELFRKIKAADYKIPNDMRVSENTKSVVQKMLLMNPHKRLSATQVLDALNSIIATWRVLLAPIGTLQVVPDIDDKKDTKEISKSHNHHPATKSTAEIEVKLAAHSDALIVMSPCNNPSRRQIQAALPPPIQQASSDAQPLSAAEIQAHRQLLHVPRQDSCNN